MVIDTVAGKEEVLERAVENLAKQDIHLDTKEMDELYEIVANYIQEKLSKESICTVKLPHLGWAYYHLNECNRRKNMAAKQKDSNEQTMYSYKLWKERAEKIEDYYQENQPGRNRKWRYWVQHVIKPMWKKNRTYGYEIRDIEEIQNAIQ